jgi:hypothetical protein
LSSRPAPAPASASAALLILGFATSLLGCGADAGAKGTRAHAAVPAIDRRVDPSEIFPADLDLVVRLDVARMRSSIGPAAASAMAARAAREAGDDVLRAALACADVVWLGARVGEIDAGDHVVLVEGTSCAPELDRGQWTPEPSRNRSVKVWDRVDPARRTGTARVLVLGDRATAFVSPMEVDSITRILADGPDARRGNPVAEGVVSLDVRAARLPPALEQKFPSIAAIIAGLERVRGTAVVVDEGVQIDVQILSPTAKGAEKALRFLSALRDNVEDPRVSLVLRKVSIEQIEGTVRIRLLLPGKVVLSLLSGVAEPPSP